MKDRLLWIFILVFSACSNSDPEIPEYDSFEPRKLPEVEVNILKVYSYQCHLQFTFANTEKTALTELILCYSPTNENPDTTTSTMDLLPQYQANSNSFETALYGLPVNNTYNCRIYMANQDTETYTPAFSFTTDGPGINSYTWEKVSDYIPYENSAWDEMQFLTVGERIFITSIYDPLDLSETGDRAELWEFLPNSKEWAKRKNIPWERQGEIPYFSINNKLFAGAGFSWDLDPVEEEYVRNQKYNWWCYDPDLDVWERKKDVPAAVLPYSLGYSINGKGYLLSDTTQIKVLEYNPVTDEWIFKSRHPEDDFYISFSFNVGNCLYVGGAISENWDSYICSLWEYNTETNQWTKKKNFPGRLRYGLTYGSTQRKGYVGFGRIYYDGYSERYLDWWEYEPITDEWEQCSVDTDWYDNRRLNASAFSTENAVYVTFGLYDGLWKYKGEKEQ